MQSLVERYYHAQPRWVNGTAQFGALIRERLRPEFQVLDLGAGSGKVGPVNFRGEVRLLLGVDPDWYISNNPRIDYAVVGLAERLPLRDASFDLVFCDWVAEHLARPEVVVAEVFRVLRPGGYFILRTGNLCHYSYAIAAATPHWFHRLVANRVRGLRQDRGDPHPTYYRMNTRRTVRRLLSQAGFVEENIFMVEAEPSYLMFSAPSFLLGVAYERLVNHTDLFSTLRACIFGSFRKAPIIL
jgi:SAM-dependent methyltransferase